MLDHNTHDVGLYIHNKYNFLYDDHGNHALLSATVPVTGGGVKTHAM